ncbi:hypothetical protein HMI54_007456, partial [Coelomomyces lativittatus]
MTSVEIDPNSFQRRTQKLFSNFKSHPENFGNADALVITVGTNIEEQHFQKSPSLQ